MSERSLSERVVRSATGRVVAASLAASLLVAACSHDAKPTEFTSMVQLADCTAPAKGPDRVFSTDVETQAQAVEIDQQIQTDICKAANYISDQAVGIYEDHSLKHITGRKEGLGNLGYSLSMYDGDQYYFLVFDPNNDGGPDMSKLIQITSWDNSATHHKDFYSYSISRNPVSERWSFGTVESPTQGGIDYRQEFASMQTVPELETLQANIANSLSQITQS